LPSKLSNHISINKEEAEEVVKLYPMQINPYILELAKSKGSSIARQFVPDIRELEDEKGMEDPLAEDRDSPVPGITHRYPDRVLFLVSNVCPSICRFCTRKRKIGKWKPITRRQIEAGITYIKNNHKIKDVLLSGGDPLLLDDDYLEFILKEVRNISHVDIIRIGTRTVTALPQRITNKLAVMLKKYNPLFINIHINHADEITEETIRAAGLLIDNGIVVSSQTVLLRDINDTPEIMINLMRELVKLRIRPYYLLQADLVKGTEHFRTRIETGISIIEKMRGYVSGMANPQYVIDLPGGGGKVPVVPDYVENWKNNDAVIKNYMGDKYVYPQPEK